MNDMIYLCRIAPQDRSPVFRPGDPTNSILIFWGMASVPKHIMILELIRDLNRSNNP